MRSRCLSFFCHTDSASESLDCTVKPGPPSPEEWGRNMSTMGRLAVLEPWTNDEGTLFLWEALPLGTELWAPNFLMEKSKQADLIKTSWTDGSCWQAGFLWADCSCFEFTILFPVLIQGMTLDFFQEEESQTSDGRDRSSPSLLIADTFALNSLWAKMHLQFWRVLNAASPEPYSLTPEAQLWREYCGSQSKQTETVWRAGHCVFGCGL